MATLSSNSAIIAAYALLGASGALDRRLFGRDDTADGGAVCVLSGGAAVLEVRASEERDDDDAPLGLLRLLVAVGSAADTLPTALVDTASRARLTATPASLFTAIAPLTFSCRPTVASLEPINCSPAFLFRAAPVSGAVAAVVALLLLGCTVSLHRCCSDCSLC